MLFENIKWILDIETNNNDDDDDDDDDKDNSLFTIIPRGGSSLRATVTIK